MTVSLACDCLRREREISLRVERVLAFLENQRTEISSQRSEISWRGSLGESALSAVGAIALTLLMSARAAFALPVTCTRDKVGGEVVSSTNRPSDRGNYRKRRCCSVGLKGYKISPLTSNVTARMISPASSWWMRRFQTAPMASPREHRKARGNCGCSHSIKRISRTICVG